MKKIITILFAIFFAPSISFAVPKYYIEGQINYTQVDDVDTTTYSDTINGDAIVGKLTNEYDTDTGYGFEIGSKNVFDSKLRVGLSYNKLKIKLKKLTVSGTVNGVAGSESYTPSQVSAEGLNFDNDVKSYSLNAYYDFETNGNLTPYVGFGLGQVDIQNANDKELSKSLYLGGRYSVNDQMYIGLKGMYSQIDGPTDKIGITYEDITQKTLSLIVGYNF
jgi:opacity protein-like surface antigen